MLFLVETDVSKHGSFLKIKNPEFHVGTQGLNNMCSITWRELVLQD